MAGENTPSGGGAPPPPPPPPPPSGGGDPGLGIGGPTPAGGTLGTPPPPDPPPASKPGDGAPPKPGDGAPAPKPTPPKTPTVGDGAPPPKPGDKEPPPAPQDWPDDWRARAAGDNKKIADRLARFKSPVDVVNSYIALEQKLSAGDYTKKLASHYTDEELAEYRKANGIPDKAEEYNVDVPGIVWGDADKPMIDSWKQFAFENHLPPDIVKLGPVWYAREQEALLERLAQADADHFQSGTAALQAKWGKEFQGNLNAAKNLLEGHPGVWDHIMGSRNAEGLRNGDNPAVLEALASIAKEINPFATIAPNAPVADQAKNAEQRFKELTRMSADKSSPYWRGAGAAAMQEEQRNLIDLLIKSGRMSQDGRMRAA